MAEPAQPPPPSDARAVALAAVLGAGATAGGAAAAVGTLALSARVLALLTKLLVRWRYDRRTIRFALRVVIRITGSRTPGAPSPTPGPAELADARNARVFAAWFLERSTARVQAAYAAGAEDGVPEERESRFIDQHLDAQERRRAAARRVDAVARKPGQVTSTTTDEDGMGREVRIILRWRAHPDDRTTPECAAADGAWFYADTPPAIGYPGMPHGGTCRCWAANAGSLAEVARTRHVNEATRAILSTDRDHRPHPAAAPERQAS